MRDTVYPMIYIHMDLFYFVLLASYNEYLKDSCSWLTHILHWHWGSHIEPSASEATLVGMSKSIQWSTTTKYELWVYISWDIFVLYIHDWFAIFSCKPCIDNRCHVPCIAVCIADQVVIITSYMYPTDQRYWSMLIKASGWLYFFKSTYTLLNTACHLIAGMAFKRASVTWKGQEDTRIVVPTTTTRGRLNIKMSSYQYRILM